MSASSDLLNSQQRNAWQKKLSEDWVWDDRSLTLSLNFKAFKEITVFIHRLLELAEEQNHHPEIHTSYTHIRIRLTTHDAGGITEKDITMAEAINTLKH